MGAGILASRIAGLVRERIFAQYFGTTLFADAFRAALRMPNVLQNLLGEGTLSASFIPVYSELLHEGREQEAGRVAGAVFALLFALAGLICVIGVLAAPLLVGFFSPGFTGVKRDITIAAVRIIFPMTGVLVLSAWALGVLNSHRRFFISYMAPVLWNAVMIATLLYFGARLELRELTIAVSWGALAGGVLQFLAQLPWVLRLERNLHIRWDTQLAGVRTALRNAAPAVLGRGVVQLSGWLDILLASFLSHGAVSALGYAQTLYLLPISLFGMSVAAAELPELSRHRQAAAEVLRERVSRGVRQIAVFVVPTMVGYLVLGDVVIATIYQTGRFQADETAFVHLVLAGYATGLLASTATRLYSSSFFALHDTRTPAQFAVLRVVVAGSVGTALMLWLRRYEIQGHALGAVGLSTAAGAAAWLEWWLLRRRLSARIGPVGMGGKRLAGMLGAALIAAALASAVLRPLPALHPVLEGVIGIGVFALTYFPLASALGVVEARSAVRRVLGRFRH